MPDLLVRFHKMYPELIIEQSSSKRFGIMEALQAGTIDFAICVPSIKTDEKFHIRSETLMYEDVYVVFPPSHRFRNRKTVHILELDGENYITSPKGYAVRDAMDKHFTKMQVKPYIVIETTDTISVMSYVKAASGFAFIPRTIVTKYPELENECTVLTGIDTREDVSVSWNEGKYKTQTQILFFEFLRIF